MRTALVILISVLMLACSGNGPLPRAEHPRPDFERAQWVNLNGEWEFRFDPRNIGLDERWYVEKAVFDARITVPFCWESELSGVADTSGRQIGWYRREIDVPAEWQGQHVWLRFEAVDWEATVWVNDIKVGSHEGGYTPFSLELTPHVQPGATHHLPVLSWRKRIQSKARWFFSWRPSRLGLSS